MQISLSGFEKTAALVYGVPCYVLGMLAGARAPFDASFFLAVAAGFFGIVLLSHGAAFLAALLEYLQWHLVEPPPLAGGLQMVLLYCQRHFYRAVPLCLYCGGTRHPVTSRKGRGPGITRGRL